MGSVVVVGSINMDLVVRVEHLPRPGDTVLGDRVLAIPGGKGANQAAAAARLGATVRMIGRVGDDAFGSQLIAGLRDDGVDVSTVAIDRSEPSGAALIVVETGGENTVTVAPGANARLGAEELASVRRVVRRGDVVLLQLEIPLDTVRQAVSAAREAGARVVLNAAPSAALTGSTVPEVDVLVLNEREADDLGGRELLRSAPAVVVTLGEAGSMLYEDGLDTPVEPRKVEAIDATGAGDAFVGALAFALARGESLVEAARLGGAAGAAAATRLGARPSLPYPNDLKRLFGIVLDPAAKSKM